jgi:3-methyladenine DNA glycosylase AlkD
VHAKREPDERFVEALPLIESAATDGRNFVKKAVSWALREIGKRRSGLNAPAVELARRLAASHEPAARWVGKDALRELAGDKVVARHAAQAARARPRKAVD